MVNCSGRSAAPLLLLLLLLAKIVTSRIPLPQDESMVTDVVECLRDIARRELAFNPRGFAVTTKTFGLTSPASEVQSAYQRRMHEAAETGLMVIGNDAEDVMWRHHGGHINHTEDGDEAGITVGEDVFIQSHLFFIRLSDFYVIVIDSYRMYNSKIRQLVRVPSWNPKAPMVVYCSVRARNPTRMLFYPRHILHSLWSYHVLNAVVLVHDSRNRSALNAYSWNPYDPPRRCGEKHQTTLPHLEVYNRCAGGRLESDRKLFPRKQPVDLMGCAIKVLGVIFHPFLNHGEAGRDDPGWDREILDVVAERMNFTVALNTSIAYWGDRFVNGTWDGMFGGIKRGLGDVAIGAVYPDTEVHEDFDWTVSYLQDAYVWVVPRAGEIPEWENLVIVLKPWMWLATVVSYAMCTVVWYLLLKTPWEDGTKVKEFVPCVLDSWCMNICASIVFRPNSDSFRIYFAFFCLYSMIWSTAYQTKLINILTNPKYEHQIGSVKDIVDSGIAFGGNEAFRFLFNNSLDKIEEHFMENYIELDIHEEMKNVVVHKNLSILTSKQYARYLSSETTSYNDEHGVPLFHLVKPSVFSFPVEMATIKGFPFLNRFNELINRLKSNGMVNLFYVRFKERCKLKAANLARKADIHDEDGVQKLTIDHLEGAFMAMLIGLAAAIVVFVVECIVHRLKRVDEKRALGKREKGRVRFFPKRDVLRVIVQRPRKNVGRGLPLRRLLQGRKK